MDSQMPKRIDVHVHFLPPSYRQACVDNGHANPDGMPYLPEWSEEAHLKLMDEEGIYAHILYPNVGGFGSGRFLQLKEPALMLESVRAYNDFAIEWAAPGKGRPPGIEPRS